MNLLLMRYGIPPVFIGVSQKKQYVQALNNADLNGDFEELYN